MGAGDETQKLIEEIRDTQREYLAEYRRVTQQSMDLQQRAVARQEQLGLVYKRMLLLGGVLVAGLLTLQLYLLARWWPYLFR
jgi:hypothetical protein